MLTITLPESRAFDERTEEFIIFPPVTLRLEHSLISIHKWESKWHKSYLNNSSLSPEEQLDYIRCMSLDPNFDVTVFGRMKQEDFTKIRDYIADPMTATVIHRRNAKRGNSNEFVTAELIYYWMVEFGIPFECAKWHLNQLLTLIEVCSVKQNTNNKMNKRDAAAMRAAANDSRRKKLGTRG